MQRPAAELETLRGQRFSLGSRKIGEKTSMIPDAIRGAEIEIVARFSRGKATRTGLRLRRSDDGQEETLLYYDWTTATITVDRSRSSINPDVKRTVDSGTFPLLRTNRSNCTCSWTAQCWKSL